MSGAERRRGGEEEGVLRAPRGVSSPARHDGAGKGIGHEVVGGVQVVHVRRPIRRVGIGFRLVDKQRPVAIDAQRVDWRRRRRRRG